MLDAIILLTGLGLVLGCRPGMGLGNPYQIYFFTWLSVFAGYRLLEDTFISVSDEFLAGLLLAKIVALSTMAFSGSARGETTASESTHGEVRDSYLLLFFQGAAFLGTPFAVRQAASVTDDSDLLSESGYTELRGAYSEEGVSLGGWEYLSVLAFVATGVTTYLFSKGRVSPSRLLLSIVTALCYLYLGTGRTYVLFLGLLTVVPLLLSGYVRARGAMFFAFFMALAFLLVAGMTRKGIDFDASFSENFDTATDNLRAYTIAPVLAFSNFVREAPPQHEGLYSFRTLTAVAYSAGLTSEPPPALVREFTFVPDPTNVYTVYELYFRDFGYAGVIIPPLLLLVHGWLYVRAKTRSGAWPFYYAASTYPLAMQFFQDQYMSLLSMWVQVSFWIWLFTKYQGLETHSPRSDN